MEDLEIPCYFLCPISLQIMRDPVTLATGITYERQSIERWLFSDERSTCPITNQHVQPDPELTPNHTLRRLIQFWCAANSGRGGVERFPTPRAPVDKAGFRRILDDVGKPDQLQAQALRRLRDLVVGSDRIKRWAEGAGAAEMLVSVIRTTSGDAEKSRLALNALHCLQPSEESLRRLAAKEEYDLVGVLTQVLRRSDDYQSRAYATSLLQSAFKTLSPGLLTTFDDGLFVELVKVLEDKISHSATKDALRALGELCPWGRNKVRAAKAGGVGVLVELLLLHEAPEKRVCEMTMIVLEQLCACAEGREALLRHGAGMAVVAKKIGRVSATVSERGVRILHMVAKFSATPALVQEMVALGVVSKLCLVLHGDCGQKTKERAREILRLHSKAWSASPCVAVVPVIHSLFR